MLSIVSVNEYLMPEGGILRFSFEKLFSRNTEKHRWETFLCFVSFLISKKILNKEGGWEFRGLPSKICCLCTKNFSGETLFCVTNFRYRKIVLLMMVRSRLPSILFCLTVPNFFEKTLLCFIKFPISKVFKD